MESVLPLLFAAVVGFSHAFEADHLLAVSNIVTRRNSIYLAIKDGIAWGLGHTSTIFLIGMLIIVFKIAISEQTFHYFEAAVGLMLLALGLIRIFFVIQKKGSGSAHIHLGDLFFRKKKDEQFPQAPLRFDRPASQSATLQWHLQKDDHRLAYAIGLVHGLAGSGALVVLVMSQIPTAGAAMLYLAIFGAGSIAGMLLASGLFSLPFSKKISASTYFQLGFTLLSSLLCIAYGLHIILENLSAS